MKTTRFLAAIGVACAIALSAMLPQAAVADDNNWPTPNGSRASGAVGMCLNAQNQAVPCSDPSALPSPVSGTFSATLAGFTPNGNFGTLTATASTSGPTALPAGAVVGFQNTSSVDVSCVLSAGAATATTNKIVVRAGATVFLTVGSNVNAACINQTGAASNVVVLAGGTGLGTNFGGSSGGGGGAITAASGSYASGALASGSMVDLGSQADAACGTDNGSCSAIALIKRGNQNGSTINTSIGNATPAGTARIGYISDDPCNNASAKTYTPINTVTANNTIITAVAAKKKYICFIFIYPGATVNFAVYQATTGTSCATAAADIFGGHTTATGFIATATAGFVAGTGIAAIAATNTVNTDICITNGGTVQLSGSIVTVDQ